MLFAETSPARPTPPAVSPVTTCRGSPADEAGSSSSSLKASREECLGPPRNWPSRRLVRSGSVTAAAPPNRPARSRLIGFVLNGDVRAAIP